MRSKIETMEQVFERLVQLDAIETGSRAFGTATCNSDYDYVLSMEDAETLKTMLDPVSLTVTDHMYFEKGYYITDGSGEPPINIIAVPKKRVEAWKITTDMLKAAPCSRIPKNYIHILFENIKAVLEKGGLS